MNAPISSYEGTEFYPKSVLKDGMQSIASLHQGLESEFVNQRIEQLVAFALFKASCHYISERQFPTDWAIRISQALAKEIEAKRVEVCFASTIKNSGPAGYGTLSISFL